MTPSPQLMLTQASGNRSERLHKRQQKCVQRSWDNRSSALYGGFGRKRLLVPVLRPCHPAVCVRQRCTVMTRGRLQSGSYQSSVSL